MDSAKGAGMILLQMKDVEKTEIFFQSSLFEHGRSTSKVAFLHISEV